jgi:hypothetical protein
MLNLRFKSHRRTVAGQTCADGGGLRPHVLSVYCFLQREHVQVFDAHFVTHLCG